MVILLTVIAVILGVITYEVRRDRALTGCGLTPPGREQLPGSGHHVRWSWSPPGYVCVYTDNGRVVADKRH